MQSRINLIEMFSTFLKVDEQRDVLGSAWATDMRLNQSMRGKVEEVPDASQEYWAQYWLKVGKDNHDNQDNQHILARDHLSAYLEEVCYWTTLRIFQQLPSLRNFSRVEGFAVAREVAANQSKLFKKYNSRLSRVKTYAQFAIRRAVLEKMRCGNELQKYYPTALLGAVSKKALEEALQRADISKSEVTKCLLAYYCFREIYPTRKNGSRQLEDLNSQQLAAIASRYNQLAQRKSEESVNSTEIFNLLKTCVKAIQQTWKLRVITIEDAPELTYDNERESEEPLTEEAQQINDVLASQFSGLPEDAQRMLKMKHGLDLIQEDIALLAGISQVQVSRHLTKHLRFLLQNLATWSAENQKRSLSSQEIGEMVNPLKEWLQQYCQRLFQENLRDAIIEENSDKIPLLKYRYGAEMKVAEVATTLQISEAEVNDRLTAVRRHLEARLKQQLETMSQSPSVKLSTKGDKKIAVFVEEWLKNAPSATFSRER